MRHECKEFLLLKFSCIENKYHRKGVGIDKKVEGLLFYTKIYNKMFVAPSNAQNRGKFKYNLKSLGRINSPLHTTKSESSSIIKRIQLLLFFR